MDRRAGRLDDESTVTLYGARQDQLAINRTRRNILEKRAWQKIPIVADYDEFAAQSIAAACLKGQAHITRGNELRHTGAGFDAALSLLGDRERFNKRVGAAWELLAYSIASKEMRAEAVKMRATPGWVTQWLEEQGIAA